MPKGDRLVLSSSPHLRTEDRVSLVMLKVLIALAPTAVVAIWFFGWPALRVLLCTTIFCVGAEALWCAMARKPVWGTIRDGSAMVTGLLLGLNLSAGIPWYGCLLGALLAIWLGKQVFGGLGHNPFNPALVARVGLLIALPAMMTTWVPTRQMAAQPETEYTRVFYDGVTCATPLGVVGTTPKVMGRTPEAQQTFAAVDNPTALKNYFWGNLGGSLGECSAAALLLGGILLVIWRLINWRIPVAFLGTVFIITGIVHHWAPGLTPSPLFHLLTGGVMLGAIFMATDMVTSPMTRRGALIFGAGCGLVTSVIRIWGNYPEGVSFAILFMNALVPLIDRACVRRPFGYVRYRGGEESK